jgi:hypothetical protein
MHLATTAWREEGTTVIFLIRRLIRYFKQRNNRPEQ